MFNSRFYKRLGKKMADEAMQEPPESTDQESPCQEDSAFTYKTETNEPSPFQEVYMRSLLKSRERLLDEIVDIDFEDDMAEERSTILQQEIQRIDALMKDLK